MFGRSKKEEEKRPTTSPSNSLNALVKGTKMTGNLESDSDFRIDGEIKGNINCRAKVIIGASGSIIGEVTCQNALIEGFFRGKLFVTEILTVRDGADVEGEIHVGDLVVQSGAVFNVSCEMKNYQGLNANNNGGKQATKVING